jgi:S-methylmethionine-dependent homocysteine/selenocysteine methylase
MREMEVIMTVRHRAKYRTGLPQLGGGMFLSDGGIETSLIFHEGFDLPMFAAFVLLESERGRAALQAYYDRYALLAAARNVGFILESPTWRASPDWGAKLGYGRDKLAEINRASIDLMREIRGQFETDDAPIVISGCIGPRGDGYDPGALMSAAEAERYHAWQTELFCDSGCDFVSAITMNNIGEATGIARAAQAAKMPCVISFTVETDGRLPTGHTLAEAIEAVDAETGSGPAYYMVNCAHPTHFAGALATGETWVKRIRGLRANASCLSHAELDNATELDIGNPEKLGEQYADLLARLPHINVLGGCCGTDQRHIAAIGEACCGKKTRKAA